MSTTSHLGVDVSKHTLEICILDASRAVHMSSRMVFVKVGVRRRLWPGSFHPESVGELDVKKRAGTGRSPSSIFFLIREMKTGNSVYSVWTQEDNDKREAPYTLTRAQRRQIRYSKT